MKASELRIGNLVYNKEKETERVYTLYNSSINGYDGNAGIQPDDQELFQPIPLTPSWLERMGFEYEKGLNTYWSIGVNPITKDYLLVIKCNNECFYYRNIHHKLKYVHQLQNLYFALTGKEIEIKQLEKV